MEGLKGGGVEGLKGGRGGGIEGEGTYRNTCLYQ